MHIPKCNYYQIGTFTIDARFIMIHNDLVKWNRPCKCIHQLTFCLQAYFFALLLYWSRSEAVSVFTFWGHIGKTL